MKEELVRYVLKNQSKNLTASTDKKNVKTIVIEKTFSLINRQFYSILQKQLKLKKQLISIFRHCLEVKEFTVQIPVFEGWLNIKNVQNSSC